MAPIRRPAEAVLRATRVRDQSDERERERYDEDPAKSRRVEHRYTGSRRSGQVIQCPPPRPLPSSKPAISITSTPAARIFEIV